MSLTWPWYPHCFAVIIIECTHTHIECPSVHTHPYVGKYDVWGVSKNLPTKYKLQHRIYTVAWFILALVLHPSQVWETNWVLLIWLIEWCWRKVCLITSILFKNEEQESYARELLLEQLARGWPGITQEVEDICMRIGLPNACQQYVGRKQVLTQIKLSSFETSEGRHA